MGALPTGLITLEPGDRIERITEPASASAETERVLRQVEDKLARRLFPPLTDETEVSNRGDMTNWI